MIRSQNLKPASASENKSEETSLERNPARLVTLMLDQEANIPEDPGDDKNMMLYSGGKVAKKSKAKNSPAVTVTASDGSCTDCCG